MIGQNGGGQTVNSTQNINQKLVLTVERQQYRIQLARGIAGTALFPFAASVAGRNGVGVTTHGDILHPGCGKRFAAAGLTFGHSDTSLHIFGASYAALLTSVQKLVQ